MAKPWAHNLPIFWRDGLFFANMLWWCLDVFEMFVVTARGRRPGKRTSWNIIDRKQLQQAAKGYQANPPSSFLPGDDEVITCSMSVLRGTLVRSQWTLHVAAHDSL